MTDSRIKGWWLHGKYYGYPLCCIDALLRGEQNWDNVFVGTGFLPCDSCSKKDPYEVMKIINTNRVCPIPFNPFVNTSPIQKEIRDYEIYESSLIWKASKNIKVDV